jgi:hypothetical protein
VLVEATDAAGNIGSASIIVSLESSLPPLSIAIQSPPDGALVSSPFLPVSGIVSDGDASVAVNGSAAELHESEFTAPVVVLAEGDNVLEARAQRGSELASDSVTVRYVRPLAITITSPRSGVRVRESTTDVSGVVDDPTAFVEVNGVVASVGDGGAFLARNVPLLVGENEIVAQATDPSGLTGSDKTLVVRDDALQPRLHLLLADGDGVVADSFPTWRARLQRNGTLTELFSPPLDTIAIGAGRTVLLCAFTDEAGEVTIPEAVDFEAPSTLALQPIDLLAAQLETYRSDLPGLIEEALPADFEPRYFAVFELRVPEPPNEEEH